MTDKLEQSVEYYVEKSFKDLLKVVFTGWTYDVQVISFVAMDAMSELPDVVYPEITIKAEPYIEMEDGAGFGSIQIEVITRSYILEDDPVGHICDKVNSNALAGIDLASITSYADDTKISIKGLVKVKQTGSSVDADSNTREKTVTYSVYLASLQKA
jgi:hypothetical protein